MAATRRKGYDLDLIANRLSRIKRTTQPDGSIAVHDVARFTDLRLLIASAVELGGGVPDLARRQVIDQAVWAAIRQTTITAASLLEEVTRSEINYYKKRELKYVLITSISATRHIRLPNAIIAGCSIRFSIDIPKRYRESRHDILDHARYGLAGEYPKDYLLVRVLLSARSEPEAWNRAIDAIDLLRGLWNLALNFSTHIRTSSGKRKPVNRLVLGPVHTLHKPTGELASNAWWYQTDYQGPIEAHNPGESKTEKMFEHANKARRLLNNHNYAEHLSACLLHYVRALDTPRWEDSYLRLWQTLEQLTNTRSSDDYDVTIRRASFLWRDRAYYKQILNHLRDHRNGAVHAGKESEDIEAYMYQLKRIVEVLIEFHLRNQFKFKSLSEAAELMGLPDDRVELDKKIRLLKAARKLHSS